MSAAAHLDAEGRCPTCGCRRPTWSVQSIVAAIREHAERTGLPPTANEWRKGTPTHPSDSVVRVTFGTWNRAIREAGYETVRQGARRKNTWTREAMEKAFLVWTFDHGRQPKWRDWMYVDNAVRPTSHMCQRAYGTWNAFVTACGYEPNQPTRTEEGYKKQAVAFSRTRDELGRLVTA